MPSDLGPIAPPSSPELRDSAHISPPDAVSAENSGTRHPAPTWRGTAAFLLLSTAVFGGAWLYAASDDPRRDGPLLTIERDGLRFDYQTVTGTESLWDLAVPHEDRRNLLRTRPEDAARLRAILADEMRVPDLEALRVHDSETVSRLRRLGYL